MILANGYIGNMGNVGMVTEDSLFHIVASHCGFGSFSCKYACGALQKVLLGNRLCALCVLHELCEVVFHEN